MIFKPIIESTPMWLGCQVFFMFFTLSSSILSSSTELVISSEFELLEIEDSESWCSVSWEISFLSSLVLCTWSPTSPRSPSVWDWDRLLIGLCILFKYWFGVSTTVGCDLYPNQNEVQLAWAFIDYSLPTHLGFTNLAKIMQMLLMQNK